MKTSYGFRATIPIRNGKRWTSKDAHAAHFASERATELVARIAPLVREGSRYEDEVPVGGSARGGAL